ncbi:hypothetical protein COMNV_01599 [Commensalibacter sp. Nvir]|uniref:DUF3035 domain-containing protein n=1 Tax=Commensalibacter sp. Nvir TaxID=3069817 RepID=UPI002D5D473C|nr:hypothetical protein COMNV_01599 [Commensalibacter sp. Nvir]
MEQRLRLNSLKPVGCLLGVLFFLSACSGDDVSRAIGLKRSMPDEYTVTTRSPLSMPPTDSLLIPDNNNAHPQQESIRQQTLEILSPDVALESSKNSGSTGQSNLVDQVTQSAQKPIQQDEMLTDNSFVDQVMFWKNNKPSDLAVDGYAENERIHSNLSLGNNPKKGATPTSLKK